MYEKQILDAIQTLVDNAIDNASFDKTIKGIISKCVDEKNGKYVILYQDSSFYAYSNDTTQQYSAGTSVYVLIPGNDMTQTKTILGSVNKLGSDYINTTEQVNRYEIIGNNIIGESNQEFGLSSYKGDVFILYNKENTIDNLIDIDITAANTYIKEAQYLILGGKFRTNLSAEQKYKGNYGLGFDLNFADNMTGETVKRTYLVDINNMTGNPYEYTKTSEQKIVFNIDGTNFLNIDKIYLFEYDFPNNSTTVKPDDLFVSNIIMNAAAALTDDELAGSKLTLLAPQGVIFDDNDAATATRTINTEIRINNKIVNSDSSLLRYYWFKENYSINSSSLLYNRYGGNGWECLNNTNIIERDDNNNPILVDWITTQSNYTITKNNTIARTTDYKCIVVYNNEIVLSKKFKIYNYSSNYIITIDSDSGVYFSYDNGSPTLTCNVNIGGDYTYKWGMFDSGNAFTLIEETAQRNTTYHTKLNRYNELQTGLNNGTILLTTDTQQELTQLTYDLEQLNSVMRVENNIIYNLQLNMITNFATFVCLVYDNNNYIGKGQIKIENDLNTSDSKYTLVINHGDQIFKYNNEGISPTSKSLENPQEIYPLSFTLFDEKGIEIDNNTINAKDVFWTVPTDDTMIKVSGVHGNPFSVDDFNQTATYTEYKQFFFEIPVLYSGNKNRNTIQLKIKYKNKIVVAETKLLFLKEGESGSNGTDFICRIVPNIIDGAIAPLYPIVTYNNNAASETVNSTINFTPKTTNVWFKAQLYHNGSEIFNGVTSGLTTENKNITIKWEMMKNKYATINNTVYEDVSNFAVNQDTGVFSYNNLNSIANETLKSNPTNIVKCTLTYDGIDYIATMPIILVKVNNSGSTQYKVSLNDNAGFRYAMYTADGRKPIYDNSNPFVLNVTQTVENVDQDISISTLTDYAVDYIWSVKGLIYSNSWTTQENLIVDTLRDRGLQRNEKYYKPVDEFNGLCLNNALYCEIKRDNITLATIHIPIHLYLNRYGNAAMNSWDGNSISIDEDGGTILAPQVGAGQKENDNSFTGVFMGTVAEAGSGETETGLFGYNSGARILELNAKDGSAKFGKAGAGQIIISPDETNAHSVLKSGSYEAPVLDEHGNIITPGEGLEIDLTDPHITFGSGNFRVDKNGNVYAKGFATVTELENGEINIPGIENFKVEYATDRVQIKTNSELYPIDTTVTKTITGKCLYKDNYVSGYTVQLIDNEGNVISNDGTTDGITVSINVTGQLFTISFTASSSRQLINAVNNYLFKFSYTPIGGKVQAVEKIFSANAIIIAEDGRSITSIEIRYQGGSSAIESPTLESGWVPNPPSVAQGNYLWTRIKIIYNIGNPDISYSVAYMGTDGQQGQAGTSSYTYVRYSANSTGNPMVENPTSETKYIGIYSGNNATVPSYSSFKWSKYVGENGQQGPVGPPGKDGTSVTIKGSYETLTQLIAAHSSGNTLGDGYVVDLNLYVFTNAAGGDGSLAGDWNDVGQFKGDDAKECFLTASTEIFKSTDGGATFSPTSTVITPFFQSVNFSSWAYSVNGGASFNTLSDTISGVSVNSDSKVLTLQNNSELFNNNSTLVFKCYSDDANIYDTITITKVQDGTSPYNVILTNESQTIAGSTTAALATTITTNIIGYMGSIQQNTIVGTISGLPTGMTATISNNNSKNTSITFTVTTSMTTKSGQITIPVTINGQVINKIFSYSLSLTGATGQPGSAGTAAKVVTINPSSQIFKSTTGIDGTFTPQYIYLYPQFQGCNYSKWQYSTDGMTWTNVTSGSNSLTIATYSSITNSLRVERNSNLFTNTITAVSFRCVSNDATVYDTITIVKLYDVTDIEIGGRNLANKNNSNYSQKTETSLTRGGRLIFTAETLAEYIGKKVTLSFEIKLNSDGISRNLSVYPYQSSGISIENSKNIIPTEEWQKFELATTVKDFGTKDGSVYNGTSQSYTYQGTNYTYGEIWIWDSAGTNSYSIRKLKLETGNKATDWTAAPEDLASNQILQYTTTITATPPTSSAVWSASVPISTEYYVWQRLQTIYDNNIIENSTPVCIYTPPIQISSIEEQYFIHTSSTAAPDQDSTSWLSQKPEWKDEYYQPATRRYLWVRTKYVYTGNISKTEYSIPYYDPTWETISALNQSIIDNAQVVENAINNGYVTIKDGYIEITDKADSSKGILLSKEGISFKINGTTYTSVWSLDGTFNAQSILVKNLNANNILSGTLTLQENKDYTENNGVLLLVNQSGAEVAKMDVNGLKVTAVDGSYIYLRTGEDDSSYKGIYLVDATGNTFVSTDTTNGMFTVSKQIVTDYQEFNGNIRIIPIGTRGIGFIGISN